LQYGWQMSLSGFASLLIPLLFSSGGLLAQAPLNVRSKSVDRRDLVYYPGDTERIVPLTRKLAANMWLDQRTIWTSPFHAYKVDAANWVA